MEREKIKAKMIIWYLIFWILFIIALYLAYGVYFIDTTSTKSKWVILFSSAVSLLFAGCKFLEISYYKYNDDNLKNLIKEQNSFNKIIYYTQHILLVVFLGIFLFFAKTHLARSFTLCAIAGYAAFALSSKIASYILLSSKIKASDKNSFLINTSLKLSNNGYVASSFVYWAILCTGIVILYHIFKDYEIIIGYIAGYCSGAFFENIIYAILKNIFEYVCKATKKYNNSEALKETVQSLRSSISNCGTSKYFETYAIILISAMIAGANSLGLMGAFLPLVVTANAIFLSVFILLFSKINKSSNPLKSNLKNILFISLFAGLAVILEIKYWLGSDFLSVGYSAVLGAICGAIVLYFNKNYAKLNETIENENLFSKMFAGLFIVIFLFSGSFLLANGIDYVLYGFYNTAVAILCFQSVILIASVFEKNEKLSICAKNYIRVSDILIVIISILAFSMLFPVEETDILNPLILTSIFAGFSIPYLIIKFILNISYKHTKTFMQCFKNKTENLKVKLVKTISFDTIFAGIIFITLALIAYFTKKYLDSETLLAFIFGINLSCCSLIYNKNETINSIAGTVLRISTVFMISITFLFK